MNRARNAQITVEYLLFMSASILFLMMILLKDNKKMSDGIENYTNNTASAMGKIMSATVANVATK